jgi:HD-GYP domain-containing protein (c-di-GMP phosphodiesterase class II)
MSMLTINQPVYTLDNELLLPAGNLISTETLKALISSNKSESYESHSLLYCGSIKKDMMEFMHAPPYKTIFDDKDKVAEILDLMKQVDLIIPVLQALDYFRQNDFYTYRHFLMVFALSTILAKDFFSDPEDRMSLVQTGPTHDIGKICVPLEILKKNSPLSRAELNFLEHHTAAGYVLLSYYYRDTRNLTVKVARDHHERIDNSGYPRAINLNDKMIEIIAVSDVYDALISPRPYRAVSYDNRTALEEITTMAEKGKFSWDVVKALVAHNRKSKPHPSETTVSPEKRGTPPSDNVYGVIAEDDIES